MAPEIFVGPGVEVAPVVAVDVAPGRAVEVAGLGVGVALGAPGPGATDDGTTEGVIVADWPGASESPGASGIDEGPADGLALGTGLAGSGFGWPGRSLFAVPAPVVGVRAPLAGRCMAGEATVLVVAELVG